MTPLLIATIVGARPQFIKAAAVSRIFSVIPDVREVLIHTGQHYDQNLSQIFFDELDIPIPDYHLGIGSMEHGAQTGRMLEAIEKLLLEMKPDWVLVYGDTNSTLAGALAAAKMNIPIAHVEAGLRSYNRRMPEEVNRVLTDHTATILFAPTHTSANNLLREGISEERIYVMGDVMYDVALYYAAKAEAKSNIIQNLKLEPHNYILATIHRAENTDNEARLQSAFQALSDVAKTRQIVLPLHPRTRAALNKESLLHEVEDCINIIEPVGYLDMVMLEKNSSLVITDSGGVQKEAFFHRVPCITIRDETEWIELVELGWNLLLPSAHITQIAEILNNIGDHFSFQEGEPYGDGHSAEQIVQILLQRN